MKTPALTADDQRKARGSEPGPSTARGDGACLAATSSEHAAPVLERRQILLALAAMTETLAVGCWKGRGGEGLPGTNGDTLPVGLKPADDRLGPRLPLRRLGHTGVEVTMLGAGGVHIGDAQERDAQEVIETAIAEGIRFFDTASMYSEGRSEQRLGRYLVPKYRDHVFLMSKSLATSGQGATADLETSLRRCGCDYLDLWQIHALKDPEDADVRVKAGVLDACERAVKEGKVKYLGFTGHAKVQQNAAIARKAGRLDDGARLKLIAAVQKSGGRDVEFYKD